MALNRKLIDNDRGAVAVEFALIFSILAVMVFGIIEFGQTYSRYEVFVGAAREGARRGAVGDTNAEILSAVTDAASGYTLSETPTITVDGAPAGDPACDETTAGESVEVTWTQSFEISIPFLPSWSPDVQIRGVFRCEG